MISTSEAGTIAALKAASNLARDLDARINLIVAEPVPYRLPIERPPVAVSFTVQRLMGLAGEASVEVGIQVYLCRNVLDALRRLLSPGSLVVIGGKRRWWPTQEERFSKALSELGCRVIFVPLRSFAERDQAGIRRDGTRTGGPERSGCEPLGTIGFNRVPGIRTPARPGRPTLVYGPLLSKAAKNHRGEGRT